MNGTSSGSRSSPGPVIGLTGGIAAGKSTVAALLTELGARVVCADQLARQVVEPGTAGLAAVVDRFGPEYLTAAGTLDRKRLARRVFADPKARKALEAILHPRIRAAFEAEVRRIRAEAPDAVIVYDAPLLIEAGAHRAVDRVIVVAVDEAVQVRRLMERDGLTRDEARARIDAQMPLAERLRHADVVIDGTAPRERIRAELERVLAELRGAQAP
jgi:dephospho-CoA kinase